MLVAALAFLFLMVMQGFLLQTAVALTGDPAPRYGRSLVTAWIAGLATTFGVVAWRWTLGLVVGLFSPWLAAGLAMVVAVAITATVFKFRLGLRAGHAIVVAGLHNLMAAGLSAGVWWLVW